MSLQRYRGYPESTLAKVNGWNTTDNYNEETFTDPRKTTLANRGNTTVADPRNTTNSNGPSGTLVYNEGTLHVPGSRGDSVNIQVINAATGFMRVVEAIVCRGCGISFRDEAELDNHDRKMPYNCSEHEQCFSDWQAHVYKKVPTTCPLDYCRSANVEFGSDRRFMQHWDRHHKH